MEDFKKIDDKFLPFCDHEFANREDNAANCTEISLEISINFSEWLFREHITSIGIGQYVNYTGEIVTTKDLFMKYYQESFGDSN